MAGRTRAAGMEAQHYAQHFGAAPPEEPHPDSDEEEGELGSVLCGAMMMLIGLTDRQQRTGLTASILWQCGVRG